MSKRMPLPNQRVRITDCLEGDIHAGQSGWVVDRDKSDQSVWVELDDGTRCHAAGWSVLSGMKPRLHEPQPQRGGD